MSDRNERLPELTAEDQQLLDRLVDVGFEIEALALNDEESRRAETLLHMLGLLDDYPVEDADPLLIDATLARIDRHEDERAARLNLEAAATGAGAEGGRRFRLPDFITAAAVILIGASVVLPMLHNLKQRSMRFGCDNNMRLLGYAFGNYAYENHDHLPMAQAGVPGWDKSVRNVVNLGPLVNGGYCEHGHLHCPGHDDDQATSYSYQWQTPGASTGWGTSRVTVILGDLNPIIDAYRIGRVSSPAAGSMNHAGDGQNVLKSDGSTMWLEDSRIGRDNIWMPVGGLREGAKPSDNDVFLAH